MKFLVLLFLVGFAASASIRYALDDAADEVLRDYVNAMELNPSLKTYMALAEGNDENEEEIKTELGKKLKEKLDNILEQINDAIKHGKEVKENLKNQAKELLEKLKDMKVDIGERAKELLKKIKEKAKDYLDKLLEKLGLKDKKEVEERSIESFREKLQKVRKWIDELDLEALKEKIENYFGKDSEFGNQLVKILEDKGGKGKKKIVDLIDRILGKEETEKRSLSEIFEKLKEYFKNLNIELKEKYLKFGQWIKDVASKGLDGAKTKTDNLKQIAREMIERGKDMSKEVAVEGLNFLLPYKEDLGSLWDQIKDTVKEIVNKNTN